MHFAHVIFGQIINIIGDFKFFCSTQNQVHTIHICQFFRFQLRITTHRRNKCFIIQFHRFSHHLLELFVRIFSHRTRVYHINIGNFFKIDTVKTLLREISSNRRSLRKIQLATQGVKSNFFSFCHICFIWANPSGSDYPLYPREKAWDAATIPFANTRQIYTQYSLL